MNCNQCPRNCHVDRAVETGFCRGKDKMNISHVGLHLWEEPCISMEKGSGTVFFSGCALQCVFCQNHEISTSVKGKDATVEDLVAIFKRLEDQGAENVNLVNPTHYTAQIREALLLYKPSIPVVWNSGGYEKAETVATLKGLVDIYLPDLKYVSPEVSLRYANASDYFEQASQAILEMLAQTGPAVFDERGKMLSGTMIRHLVLPSNVADSLAVLRWIKENAASAYVSLMCQYFPTASAFSYEEINRRLRRSEYKRVVDAMLSLDLTNGFIQELGSSLSKYVPKFEFTF